MFAYEFTSPLEQAEMFQRLQRTTTREWIPRSSDRFGDYMLMMGVPGAKVQVFFDEPNPGKCMAAVLIRSVVENAEEVARQIREELLEKILPLIEATGVTEIEYID